MVDRERLRPLLKWAGGKRQLLPQFRRFYPPTFGRYYEPFLGSAAVFFDLCAAGRLVGLPAHLTDSNGDLIGCYAQVRGHPSAVVSALGRLEAGYRAEGATHYYEVRRRFNEARSAAPAGSAPAYTPELAAMFVYLNRTGYNGLFRLSADGRFNVPAGRYRHPTICDPRHVQAVASALRASAAAGGSLRACRFDEAISDAECGDFLYFDPPYAPLSATSSFGAYTATRFTDADQARLCDAVVTLARRGCAVMLSNSSAPSVEALYARAVKGGTGLRLWRLPARRSINSRATARGPVDELLLTNLQPGPDGAGPARAGGR